MPDILVGCDVGGTFTDAVALDTGTGRRTRAKAPTTPGELPVGVVDAVQRTLDALDRGEATVDRVLHGTTVATNALLEDELAPVALVTNDGLEDVLEIGRQDRPSLYDLDATGPEPIVPRERRFGLGARMDADGSIRSPVDPSEVDDVADRIAASRARAVAVCLLHAHRSGEQEQAAAERLRERLDGTHVVTSHGTSPEFREVERFTTTVVNAGLAPLMRDYIASLRERLAKAGVDAPVSVLDSAGALVDPAEAARLPVRMVLSGPAGGVAALDHLDRATGNPSLLGVDMGGTSTDVSLLVDGEPSQRWTTEVAGRRLQVPAADVHTVGAGGGSIAWVDEAGGLRVGPASAGADPGPACYGRGGADATLTDANLWLGRIPPGTRLGGEMPLDEAAAREVLEALADQVGEGLDATARSIVEIATARAVRGVRVLTARHAADPEDLALAAFGGAGPQLGAEWGQRLGIGTVLVPRHAGVTSAAGLLAAPPRVERSRTVLRRLDELSLDALEAAFEPLEAEARGALDVQAPRLRRAVSARYLGQSHELTVPVPDDGGLPALRDRFEAAHEEHHGYALPDTPIELVTLRVRALDEPAVTPDGAEPPETRGRPTPADEGQAWFLGRGSPSPTEIHDAAHLEPGHAFDGPAIVRGEDTTALVPPGWATRVEGHGHLVLSHVEGSP